MNNIDVINAEEAVDALHDFINGADIDNLARLVSLYCRDDEDKPVSVECGSDRSAQYTNGKKICES